MKLSQKRASIPNNDIPKILTNPTKFISLAHLIPDQGGSALNNEPKKQLFMKCLLAINSDISRHFNKPKSKKNSKQNLKFLNPNTIIQNNLKKCLEKIDSSNEVEIINKILFNEPSHIVALFKEYLIYDDCNEFLHRLYKNAEIPERMDLIVEYYSKKISNKPWQHNLPEIKIFLKSTSRKLKIYKIREEDIRNAHKNREQGINSQLFKSSFLRSMDNTDISKTIIPYTPGKVNLLSFLNVLTGESTILNENFDSISAIHTTEPVMKVVMKKTNPIEKNIQITPPETRQAKSRPKVRLINKALSSDRCTATRQGTQIIPLSEICHIKSTNQLKQCASVGVLGKPIRPSGNPIHTQRKLVMPPKENSIIPKGTAPSIRLVRNDIISDVRSKILSLTDRKNENNNAVKIISFKDVREKLNKVYGTALVINKLHQKHAKSTDNAISRSKVSPGTNTGCKIRNVRALKETERKKSNLKERPLVKEQQNNESTGVFKVHYLKHDGLHNGASTMRNTRGFISARKSTNDKL